MLKAKQIEQAKPKDKPYRMRDGRGLYVEVRPSGGKYWRYRYKIYRPDGKAEESMFALGAWVRQSTGLNGQYTLEEARTERDKARGLVKQGMHPVHLRNAAKLRQANEAVTTFEGVARDWLERRSGKKAWTVSHRRKVEGTLEREVFEHIGALPIVEITTAHLSAVVKRVEDRGAHAVEALLRQWFSAICNHAIRGGILNSSPAAALGGDEKDRPATRHHPHLDERDMPAYFQAVSNYGGGEQIIIMLKLLPLVFTRPSELREARWTEVDLDRGEWLIPAERMKMREKHLVPLSNQSVALLQRLRKLTGHRDYLFPNSRDPRRPASRDALNRALGRMGYAGKLSAHGFRGTASTMLHGMGFNSDWIERQLAHKPRGVRAAYDHSKFLPERRNMMQAWANLIDQMAKADSNVTPINRVAA